MMHRPTYEINNLMPVSVIPVIVMFVIVMFVNINYLLILISC